MMKYPFTENRNIFTLIPLCGIYHFKSICRHLDAAARQMSTVRRRLSWGIVVAGLRDICTLAVDAMLRLGGMSRCIVIHRRE